MSKLGYLIKEGFRGVFKHGFMTFASVTIMVACLVIMGCFSLLSLNIDALIRKVESQNEIVAYVDESLSVEDAQAIQAEIERVPNIRQVEFVTREEAMEKFAEEHGTVNYFSNLDSSVFRHRFIIYIEDISLMEDTLANIEKVPGIADTNAYPELAKSFVTVRNVVSAVSLVLVVILLVISVFIISNTIKLTSFGRREEIAIMKMVGANNAFIRFPYVVEGLTVGIMGSVIAFLIQWGIYVLVSDKVMASIAGSFMEVIPYNTLMLPVGMVFLAIGLIVGAFGGNIAIRNYLKV